MIDNAIHTPVMCDSVLKLLNPRANGVYVDCTLGFGGHSAAILQKIGTTGHLYGIDQDDDALAHSQNRFVNQQNFTALKGNFCNLKQILQDAGVTQVDGILADIGVSSYQLDVAERGFSFRSQGPLDMRMDRQQTMTAKSIVNAWTAEQLTDIFKRFGEERWSKPIAKAIVSQRQRQAFTTTDELAKLCKSVVPNKFQDNIHPATRVFQALRIAVNDELSVLELFLAQAIEVLRDGGRLAVITFHSLEDRIVKQFCRRAAKACICPPEFPLCRCRGKALVQDLTRKARTASAEEIVSNPRSRSAKLRAIECF